MTLTVGSLFSGIGGLDLGLERAGMNVIWQSEIDPYASRVLKKHWPEVPNYGDIKTINWGDIVRPDVICGGYPCQPFSTAGKRKGTDDPRHLWPWVRQAISELRPRYAILENVRGHLSLGGLSVIGELASIGYDTEWRIVSAASVGANHRRDRIVIVAYPQSEPSNGVHNHSRDSQQSQSPAKLRNSGGTQTMADTNSQWRHEQCEREICKPNIRGCCQNVANSESTGCNRNRLPVRQKTTHPVFASGGSHTRWHKITKNWEIEPNVGRVAYGVPSRVDRLRGLGNAVVPQVAEVIGRLVIEHSQAC
jgi:DNA (cytosine-5)-methyltransferase 1